MSTRVYSDTAPQTTVLGATTNTGGISAGDTNLVVGVALHTYFNSAYPFVLSITDADGVSNEELVLVTSGGGVVGNPYVITRAYGNGVSQATLTAKSHALGSVVRHKIGAVDLKELDDHVNAGRATHGSAISGEKVSSGSYTNVTTANIASSASEVAIASYTVPANDAAVGSLYRLVVAGVASVTGTPTLTLRARLGGVAGTQIGADFTVTAGSGVTNKNFRYEVDLQCVTTGVNGTWNGSCQADNNLPTTAARVLTGTTSAITKDTTVTEALVITGQFNASSSSNTVTVLVAYLERVV